MKLIQSNRGALSTGVLNTAIIGIILLVILFQLYAELIPEAQAAGDTLNASGVPLGGLFTSQEIVFLIIMAALIVLVVKAFMPGGGGK